MGKPVLNPMPLKLEAFQFKPLNPKPLNPKSQTPKLQDLEVRNSTLPGAGRGSKKAIRNSNPKPLKGMNKGLHQGLLMRVV